MFFSSKMTDLPILLTKVANTPLNHGTKSKSKKILLGKRPPSESRSSRPGPASKRKRAATPHPEKDQVFHPSPKKSHLSPKKSHQGPKNNSGVNIGATNRNSETEREREDAQDYTDRIPEAALADSSDDEVSL